MALQHLRSSTANKRPLPAGMSDGQLAINTNLASPGLFLKNSNGDLVKVGPVHVGTTAPNASPAAGGETGNTTGELWLDTSLTPNELKTWSGSAWVSATGQEIPVSKLIDGSARQLLQTDAAGTGVEWTSNVDVPGTLDVTSTATFDSIASHPLGSAGAPTITFTGDTNTGIYSPGADQLALSTNGTKRLQIDSGGNVSIDAVTDTGTKPLSIYSAARDSEIRLLTNSGTERNAFFTLRSATGNVDIYATTGDITLNPGNTERLRITSAGLVGVGTSSPSSTLHVSGSGTVVQQIQSTGGATELKLIANTQTNASYNNIYSGDGTSWNWRIGGGDGTTNTLTLATGGSERLRIDSSGRVGIGTSSVSNTLDIRASAANVGVRSTTSGQNQYIFFSNTADSTNGVITHTGNELRLQQQDNVSGSRITFYTKDSEKVRIDDQGRLGIGSNNPQRKLVVSEGGAQGFEFYPGDGGGGNTLNHYNRSTAAFIDATTTADQHIWGRADGEKARIDSSGRLLVGTSSARSPLTHASRLQVEGTDYSQSTVSIISNSSDASGPTLLLGKSRSGSLNGNTVVQNGDDLGQIYFLGADGSDLDSRAATIKAQVDGTPGANDMPGRLVFSTTADGASSSTERMRIKAVGTTNIFGPSDTFWVATSATGTSDAIFVGSNGASGINGGSVKIKIYSDGDIENTNNSYGALSDSKLKENIIDATSQWEDIKALQVRKYNLKPDTGHSTHTQIGLIAQEAELVSPGLVSESPDRDAEGNDLGTTTKSVNYSVLYMKAVKALQEAMERIEILEASNTDLLARVSALESA